jgi:DNA-binding NarL/FixJ family response regulator
MKQSRILVVDDNSSIREAIALIIEEAHDLMICGEASSIAEALTQSEILMPDLALVDLSLKGGGDGIALIRQLCQRAPSMSSVVFSLHDEAFYIDAAREVGAKGYVIKGTPPKELITCLRQVSNGQNCFPRSSTP